MTATTDIPADLRMPMRMALTITFETPVNIGGYGAPTFVDRPFRRDSDGWPFIPASSLKGRLRHECERLARALDHPVCNGPNPREMCRGGEQDVCPVCKIWGSPWITGSVYPADLILERPPELGDTAPPPAVRYNVSISRRRRVAEDAHLFTTELFLPGIPLTFSSVWEARLCLQELALVEAGLGAITALGRAKTGGLGWCTIRAQTELQSNGEWLPITADDRARGRAAWQR
ncbi:MAG: RAMP superfamily CRISPR-associated protein [Anaerolineae bacterium]